MITTSNAAWDATFRLLRQHGMSVPDTVRHKAREVIFEEYPVMGYNFRMTDIQAAVGREQLQRVPGVFATRRAIADRYRALLASIPGLGLPVEPAWARTNYQSFCVRLPDGCDQRAVMQALLDAEISSRRGVMCSHREKPYAGAALRHPLPHSEAAQERCVLLPLFPQMAPGDPDRVAEVLARACGVR
jgi:dTDP-4-amino-4,6-dideoxygalactose transaminase